MNLSDCIKHGWVTPNTADKMVLDVEARRAALESGYVAYLKNGLGP